MTQPDKAALADWLSEQERHAVEHARYLAVRATTENPDCCFDYGLVHTLVQIIDRARSADGMREAAEFPKTIFTHPSATAEVEDKAVPIISNVRADGMREALEEIYETLSSLDRPTVNQQNAFEHFSALNGTLLEIKRIAKSALAAPSVKTNSGLR